MLRARARPPSSRSWFFFLTSVLSTPAAQPNPNDGVVYAHIGDVCYVSGVGGRVLFCPQGQAPAGGHARARHLARAARLRLADVARPARRDRDAGLQVVSRSPRALLCFRLKRIVLLPKTLDQLPCLLKRLTSRVTAMVLS